MRRLRLERETGFEPATLSLGSSTWESGPIRPTSQGLVSVGLRAQSKKAATGPNRPVSALSSGNLPARCSLRALRSAVDDLLSVREVGRRLGVTTATVYKLAERGELPHIRISNAIRVAPADLAAYIASRRKGNQ